MTFKKKLLTFVVIGIVGWTSYYDLNHGTLSLFFTNASQVQAKTTQAQSKINAPKPSTKKIVVQPGDTVLSIEERLNPNQTVSIAQVITDFKTLNQSINPNHIQIGHTYTFKLYSHSKNKTSSSKAN